MQLPSHRRYDLGLAVWGMMLWVVSYRLKLANIRSLSISANSSDSKKVSD